jgi:outer membrane lipoprotein-sorting protein
MNVKIKIYEEGCGEMKKSFWLMVMLTLLSGAIVCAEPARLNGREIMAMVHDRPDGDTDKQLLKVTLVNKGGSKRVRSMWSYRKDYGKDKKKIFYFEKPADVKGVTFLTWQYDDPGRDDDRWLYLPALKKARRISGSSKNEYFMGTDFTYDDLGGRSVDEENHTLLKEETVDGQRCWVVQTIHKDPKDIYGKRISWIRQDCLIPVKVDYYDRQQKLLKFMLKSEIMQKEGFWTAMQTEMKNVQENHESLMEVKSIKYNVELKDSFFTVSTLERGVR